MSTRERRGGLDWFRLVAAILVVGIHTYPLLSINPTLELMTSRVFGRIAVPFFFMVSGYFLLGPYAEAPFYLASQRIKHFLAKNVTFYFWVSLFYLPLGLYSGLYSSKLSLLGFLKLVVVDGTFYHLWYLPALLASVLFFQYGLKKINLKKLGILSVVLYLIGLMGDSYSQLFFKLPLLATFFERLFIFSSYTRNGLFYGPIFLFMGAYLYTQKPEEVVASKVLLSKLLVSLSFLLAEGWLLHLNAEPRHDSMYLSLVPVSYYLFKCLLSWHVSPPKISQEWATGMYFLHPYSIVIIRLIAKVLKLENLLIANSLVHFFLVIIVTLSLIYLLLKLKISNLCKTKQPNKVRLKRAWKRVSTEKLIANYNEINLHIPRETEIMAVIKADAYGHDSRLIAKVLEKEGVTIFAVATLEEGIALRVSGVKADILILGYTSPAEVSQIQYYQLIQTIVSQAHGAALIKMGIEIRCHLKIDSGMHRLGIEPAEIEALLLFYQSKTIHVEGIYSHLGSADSLEETGIKRTRQQIAVFEHVLTTLEQAGIECGKRHLQSSYGLLNYPELRYDYVRVGMLLYGSYSQIDSRQPTLNIQPILTLYSQVMTIKSITPGEIIGYGEKCKATTKMTLATISIGYADGIPRALSNQNYYLSFEGQRLKQVGNICMDMLTVDVTGVKDLMIGSTVIIMGETATSGLQLAHKSQTITNEIFSRLGTRLAQ